MSLRRIAAGLVCALSCGCVPPASGAQPPGGPDVLVVGGTPAGVAAAVAAARRGVTVELVAQRPQLGGILTDAMMDQWDLNLARDGEPIEGGIFSEIYARLGDSFTPAQAAATFAALVSAQPRIAVVVDARPTATRVRATSAGRVVDGVDFRGGDGAPCFEVDAPQIIDATDNGDVAALAGARYDVGRQDTGRDERMQPVTLIFTVTGVDWRRLQRTYDPLRDGFGGVTDRRAWGYADVLRTYHPAAPDVVVDDLNLGHEDGGSITVNAIDVTGIDGRSDRDLRHARSVTQLEAPRLVAFLRDRLPGFEHAAVGRYAERVYVRETRHFAGIERITAGEVWDGAIPADTIGLSSYPLDLHPVSASDKPAFAPVRHVYGVPFGSLVPLGFTNLLLASPAISASHLASGSARIIPTTIEEGEAAGAAAALAGRARISFADLARSRPALAALRDNLARRGVILLPAVSPTPRTPAGQIS